MPLLLDRRAFLAGTGAAVALHPFALRAQANQAHLRLMETTDIHVHVWPYDYYADAAVETAGLARTAALVEDVRKEAANALLLDNGDFVQGNPLGDYVAYERGMEGGATHPVIDAMNVLGVDAGTLGNHEFNYGLPFLEAALAGTDYPVVCANVAVTPGPTPLEDETLVPPYVILDAEVTDGAGDSHPIRVGIIGFVPPQIMQWDRQHLEGRVTARDIVTTARAWVPRMRAEGAEIVVALAHTGIGPAEWTDGMEDAAIPLAAVPGIDAVLTGHQHRVFPGEDFAGTPGVDAEAGTIGDTPAVMAGYWGSHMGLIDLMLERGENGWRVAEARVEARPIYLRDDAGEVEPTVASVDAVLDATRAAHDETLAYVRRAVGRTDAPLHSYFALVADDPSVQIVSNAQAWYIERMMAGTEFEGLPILSAAAPFKAGGRGGPDYYTDVPAGDVAIRNVADLYLYPNTVRAVKVTGAGVREWLERSAGAFNRIVPGEEGQELLNPDFASYNFDVIDGVTYRIDLSQPAKYGPEGEVANPEANRIQNLSIDGQKIDDEQEFIVATNNYRAGGGGSFPGLDGAATVFEAPDTNRDVVVRYLAEQGTVSPRADANWSFAPMEGTTVLFDSGPAGMRYADRVEGVAIDPVGEAEGGFYRYRIAL